jgi:hypothetical protein
MDLEIINLAKNSFEINKSKVGVNIEKLKKFRKQFISNIEVLIQAAVDKAAADKAAADKAEVFLNILKTKIDVGINHIMARYQNLILSFGLINEVFLIPEGVVIAGKTGGLTRDETKSSVWCPLIFKALYLCNFPIPEPMRVHHDETINIELDVNANELKNIDNWYYYAMLIFIKPINIPDPSNPIDIDDPIITNESKLFTDYLNSGVPNVNIDKQLIDSFKIN